MVNTTNLVGVHRCCFLSRLTWWYLLGLSRFVWYTYEGPGDALGCPYGTVPLWVVRHRESYLFSRPWSSIQLGDVEAFTFARKSANRWRCGCQPCTSAAFSPKEDIWADRGPSAVETEAKFCRRTLHQHHTTSNGEVILFHFWNQWKNFRYTLFCSFTYKLLEECDFTSPLTNVNLGEYQI
jgi:hypothetical protein